MSLLLLVAACAGPASDADARREKPSDSADTSAPGDSGETGEASETGETGEAPETSLGLLSWSGEAGVSGPWEGSESVLFVGDQGLGETWCALRYAIEPVAARTDCAACLLAYDVELGAPELLVSTLCAEVGYDEAAIAALAGQRRGYGLALDYLGHSNVLMFDDAGVWKAVAFVSWDEGAATLSYAWEQGYVEVVVPAP